MAKKTEQIEERVLSRAEQEAVAKSEGLDVSEPEEATQEASPAAQEASPADMMAELMALKAEMERKMAALDAREALLNDRDQKGSQEKPAAADTEDPWKETREMFVPRAAAGEQKVYYVSVNGKAYKVPRGRHVEMPLPVYERLMLMLEREAAAQQYRDSIPEEGMLNEKQATKAYRA